MAKEVEKRSGKATRQHYKKDRRETVIQVRMNAEELAPSGWGREADARARIICVARCAVLPVPTRSTRSLRTLRSSTGC